MIPPALLPEINSADSHCQFLCVCVWRTGDFTSKVEKSDSLHYSRMHHPSVLVPLAEGFHRQWSSVFHPIPENKRLSGISTVTTVTKLSHRHSDAFEERFSTLLEPGSGANSERCYS